MVSIGPPARRAAFTAFSSFFAEAFGAFFLTTTGSQSCVKGPTPAISDGELRLDENNCHIAIHHHINSHTGTSCRHWKVKLLWHDMINYFCSKQMKLLTALCSMQSVTDTHQTRPHVGSKTTNTIQGINYFLLLSLRIAVTQLRIHCFFVMMMGSYAKRSRKIICNNRPWIL